MSTDENNLQNQPEEELTHAELNKQHLIRLEKLKELQEKGKDPFVIVKFDVTTYAEKIHSEFEKMEGEKVSVAGRIMTKRNMGKASFCDVLDKTGRIQSYVKKDDIGEEDYEDFKHYDIGDIVGISGVVFKTQKGEISVKAEKVTLLAKSLQVLPEKFHGLKDQEIRFRQRYLDLISNPEVKEAFIKRSKIIRGVREFLDNRDFLEVETPVLQTIAGGASARPFLTHHNSLDMDMYLRISLELPLKRLIVGGMDRVYEIGRVFRNEGMSVRHNPEFTLLELYQAYTDYHGMMELTESLIKEVALKVTGSGKIEYMDNLIDLESPFKRITMVECVKEHTGIDFDTIETLEEAKAVAKEKHIKVENHHQKGDILNLIFEEYCEKHLIQPTFIMDHPVEISPLTKRKPTNPQYTERFELFIVGREYANAYSELNDPVDQRARFMHQEELRAAGDDEANMIDEDFMLALEYAMPPTGGLGIGMDRLIMLLTQSNSIRDVLFFPTMKPESV